MTTKECQHEEAVQFQKPEGIVHHCMKCDVQWIEAPEQKRRGKWAHYRKAKKPSRKRG